MAPWRIAHCRWRSRGRRARGRKGAGSGVGRGGAAASSARAASAPRTSSRNWARVRPGPGWSGCGWRRRAARASASSGPAGREMPLHERRAHPVVVGEETAHRWRARRRRRRCRPSLSRSARRARCRPWSSGAAARPASTRASAPPMSLAASRSATSTRWAMTLAGPLGEHALGHRHGGRPIGATAEVDGRLQRADLGAARVELEGAGGVCTQGGQRSEPTGTAPARLAARVPPRGALCQRAAGVRTNRAAGIGSAPRPAHAGDPRQGRSRAAGATQCSGAHGDAGLSGGARR